MVFTAEALMFVAAAWLASHVTIPAVRVQPDFPLIVPRKEELNERIAHL